LLKRQLFIGKWRAPVAVDDQNADRLALAPERGAAHRAGSRRAGERRTGPVGDRGIDVIEVRDVDLAVLGNHRAGQIPPSDPGCCQRQGRTNQLRAAAETKGVGPLAVFGKHDGDAGGAEQPRGGLCDLLQRRLGIARYTRDRAQDVGAGGLVVPSGAKLAIQPGGLGPNGRLPRDGIIALGERRLELLLQFGYPLLVIGCHFWRKRGHPVIPLRAPHAFSGWGTGQSVRACARRPDYPIPGVAEPAPSDVF
jgi:hypothetical protein